MLNRLTAILLICCSLCGCMKWDADSPEDFEAATGLFICCEGNFQYGNATLSYYNPSTSAVENEVFYRANRMKLGDVVQSMIVYDNRGWIVVNNSHVVFAIDPVTFRELGRIEGLTSPRYIHFVSPRKAYITQLWDNRIFIADPATYSITGYIEVPGMTMGAGSTEQMTAIGKYVYCTCWSYQNRIIKIDTETDAVVDEIAVGIQPRSIASDCNGKLWTITDGGYEESPYGYEAPALYCIDPERMEVERQFRFKLGDTPRQLMVNGSGDRLYWLNDDVWTMDVTAQHLPARPIIESNGTLYYGLTVDPVHGDIYVADAIDYQQPGIIYRFNSAGRPLDNFYVGINPGTFCWR